MNNSTFIGNLTRDPQTKNVTTANGATTATEFSIAVNGRTRDDVFFVKCTAWGKAGESIAKYMTKGSKIFVAGPIKVAPYLSKDGKPQASIELTVQAHEFLSSAAKAAAPAAPNYDAKVEEPVPVDESIPF